MINFEEVINYEEGYEPLKINGEVATIDYTKLIVGYKRLYMIFHDCIIELASDSPDAIIFRFDGEGISVNKVEITPNGLASRLLAEMEMERCKLLLMTADERKKYLKEEENKKEKEKEVAH